MKKEISNSNFDSENVPTQIHDFARRLCAQTQ